MVSDVMNMVMTQMRTPERPSAESPQTGDSYRDKLRELMDAGKKQTDRPDTPQKGNETGMGKAEETPQKNEDVVQQGINLGFSLFFAQNMQSEPVVLTQLSMTDEKVAQIDVTGEQPVQEPARGGEKMPEQPFAAVMTEEQQETVSVRAETEEKPVEKNVLFSVLQNEKGPEIGAEEMQPVAAALNTDAKAVANDDREMKALRTEQSSQLSVEKIPEKDLSGKQEEKSGAALQVTDVPQPMRQTVESVVSTARSSAPEEIPEAVKNLPEEILNRMSAGEREFTIQLQPENLGKLTIKASYEEGRTTVSIVCTDSKTLNILSGHAKELGAILESNLGTPTNIILDHTKPDYLQQGNGQSGQEQQNQPDKQEQEKKKGREQKNGQDFLQQLRLGLV